MENNTVLLYDEAAISRTIKRIAHEILEKNEKTDDLCIIGVLTRGVPLAQRIAGCIYSFEQKTIPTGTLDISSFRDDMKADLKKTDLTDIGFDITGKNVIITDDVLCTGRTARAALDAVISLGRPSKIQLAVLVDRGHRELPIRPDYVGKNIPTSRNETIKVMLTETDGTDKVEIMRL